jgi:hypothetical protein
MCCSPHPWAARSSKRMGQRPMALQTSQVVHPPVGPSKSTGAIHFVSMAGPALAPWRSRSDSPSASEEVRRSHQTVLLGKLKVQTPATTSFDFEEAPPYTGGWHPLHQVHTHVDESTPTAPHGL